MPVAHGEDNRDDSEKFTLKACSSKRLVGSLDKKGAKGPRGEWWACERERIPWKDARKHAHDRVENDFSKEGIPGGVVLCASRSTFLERKRLK